MTDSKATPPAAARRMTPETLFALRRERVTPYRVRCTACGKILGEVSDGGAATLCCAPCRRLTLALVRGARLALVDLGPARWLNDADRPEANG